MSGRSFDAVVRAHAPAVHAYARALTNDSWLAEEAVQETFLRAWKYQDSFRGTGSYEGWLLRICRNSIVDLAARRPKDRSIEEVAERPEPGHDGATVAEVGDALASLSTSQREVLTVCGVLGYDYESAAELLGVPIGTIRSRLHRARAALSEQLDGLDHEPTDEAA